MKTCIFTIVAKNYIGLGKLLEQSARRHNPEANFRIYVVDEMDETTRSSLSANVIAVRQTAGYTDEQWTDMAFKYDLTELCTAVKPGCFQNVLQSGYDNAVYFDPDIYIFAPIDPILHMLEQCSIVLTPQIARLHEDYRGEHPEWAMNVNGIFNLGFCAMHNTPTAHKVLQWWRKRLEDNCFVDRSVGNFTDQKWMDWMPGLLLEGELRVAHHLGMNMAPWNYFERSLYLHDGHICVRERGTQAQSAAGVQLIFLHFAGYDYRLMLQGQIERKRINNLKEYDDIKLATCQYMHAMQEGRQTLLAYINLPYTYSTYQNGQRIDSFHRRLYHGLRLNGEAPPNPFHTGEGTLYRQLSKRGMIQGENIDRLNQRNMPDIDKKHKMIHRLFRLLYRLMGYKRYTLFIKSLYNYCRPELHTFLLKR